MPGSQENLMDTIDPLMGDNFSTLGETPAHTTLTVTYTTGEGIQDNAPANVVTEIEFVEFYDDPNTTSQCTYKVYMALQDTSGTVNIYGESNNYGYATAMEVLA